MRCAAALITLLLFAFSGATALAQTPTATPQTAAPSATPQAPPTTIKPPLPIKKRANLPDLEDELMCLVCGTSLQVAEADSANQERDVVRKLIDQGFTKQQIKDEMVRQYGPKILADPPTHGFDLTVWLVPIGGILLGLGGVFMLVRRWRNRAETDASDAPAPTGPALDPSDAARLDRELQAFDA